MKFAALAGLVASASALDFIGCHGANFGNEEEERRESDCIFRKLSGGGEYLTKPEMVGALDKYCQWYAEQNGEHYTWNECLPMADKYEAWLVNNYGHDGELTQSEFFHAYMAVKTW